MDNNQEAWRCAAPCARQAPDADPTQTHSNKVSHSCDKYLQAQLSMNTGRELEM